MSLGESGGAMTFRETLDKHLRAIQSRALSSLAETLPEDRLTLIMSDGRLVQTAREFLRLHEGWFQQTTWSLLADLVEFTETPEMGVAVLRLDYSDDPPDQPAVRETSLLTLIFAHRDGRWVLTHD